MGATFHDFDLKPDESYLLSTDSEGLEDFCSVRRRSSNTGFDTEVSILRSLQRREIDQVVDPWIFERHAHTCELSYQFATGRTLTILLPVSKARFCARETIRPSDARVACLDSAQ